MEQETCFLCKSTVGVNISAPFNCEKHQQEVKLCQKCYDNKFEPEKCSFCESELLSPPIPPSGRFCFLFLINVSLNDRNVFPVVTFNEQKNEVGMFHATPKSEEFFVNEYAGVCGISNAEFLITGGFEMDNITNDAFILGFLPVGHVYHYQAEKLPQMLSQRYSHIAFAVDRKKFVVAGGLSPDMQFLKSCEVFQDNVWKQGPELAHARSQASGFSHGGYLYVFGGFNGPKLQENSFERLNESTMSVWEEVKLTLNESSFLTSCRCLSYKNGALIVGGSNGKNASPGIYSWDFEKNEIRKKEDNMKYERANTVAVLLNQNDLLVLGGEKDFDLKVELIELNKLLQYEFSLDENENEKSSFNVPGYHWLELK